MLYKIYNFFKPLANDNSSLRYYKWGWQFVNIILKTFACLLCNWAKLCSDNLAVKRLLIIYNNKEMALYIRPYIFKDLKKLDIISFDFK